MTHNQIKNLSFSIFCTLVIGYAFILNFSQIGLAAMALAIGAIFVTALVYNKQQSIVEKIDLYAFFTFLGILLVHYDQIIRTFTMDFFSSRVGHDTTARNISIGIIILGLIFNAIANKRVFVASLVINKYLGLFFAVFGMSIFFLARVDIELLTQFILIFSLFGLAAFCRFKRKAPSEPASQQENAKSIKRLSRLSFCLAVISLILKVFCPAFHISQYNFRTFLNITVFPWYSVMGITLLLTTIVGIGLHYGQKVIDEDTIFLTGLVGFVWVVKASVFFWFDFHWMAICIYVLIFFGFTSRFVKRTRQGRQTAVHVLLRDNEFYWLPIAAISTVISIFLINAGYIWFWFSLIIGVPWVIFAKEMAVKWIKEAIFWTTLLFCIASAAIAISLQNAYSLQKVIMIAGIFVFTSIAIWMLNHNNTIGQNKFKNTKIAIAIVFMVLVIIPALKAGSKITVEYEVNSAKVGSLVRENGDLRIKTSADGKNNSIKKLSYVWSDKFWYEKDDVVEAARTEITTNIAGKHLIVWTEDAYGVVTKSDYWFYDEKRNAE